MYALIYLVLNFFRCIRRSEESSNEYDDVEDEVDMDSDCFNELDELGSLKNFDTRSRFTDYSMSSSAITRNSQLTQLDETFEQVMEA